VAPVSAATVSSLMMGFAWGTGGLMVPLVGLVADRIGLNNALTVVAISPVAAASIAAMLPAIERPAARFGDSRAPASTLEGP
jgi:MFS transporter, FSR family, fosmidomycin resistance protein